MDPYKKRAPDYTDIAYREAVTRLKYLLEESYNPTSSVMRYSHYHAGRPDDSDNETEASFGVSDRFRHGHVHTHTHYFPYKPPYMPKRAVYTDTVPRQLTHAHSTISVPQTDGGDGPTKSETLNQPPPPELLNFIDKQEEYIEQLEKESQYCREELSNLLSKVKEVISENEHLHEKEKLGVLKSVFDSYETADDDDDNNHILDDDIKIEKKSPRREKKKRLEGPSIVFESRITELEAQLTQTKLDLKKAQEEAESYKRKLAEQPYSSDFPSLSGIPSLSDSALRQQVEALQKEKNDLNDKVIKLQSSLAEFKEKEADASFKVKRSKDIMDQTQFEKTQLELEVRRLKDELERQHEKQRELVQEQGRRIQDERSQAERRYAQQVEQLSTELAAQWDNASKLQLDLEKQRRIEAELRRDLQQKQSIIDELKKELATKTSGLQSEVLQATVERGSVEQELITSRLAVERAERDARQETSRLQAEVNALRQRLDRADADLLHSRRENFRLSEQISSLERELNLAKLLQESGDKGKSASSGSPDKASQREKELSSLVANMENKHVQTVAELENMIKSQNQVMEKLKDECRLLTEKLEESSARHKLERADLRGENAVLTDKLEQLWGSCKELLGAERYQKTSMMGGPILMNNNLHQMYSMDNMNHIHSNNTSIKEMLNLRSNYKGSQVLNVTQKTNSMPSMDNKCLNPNMNHRTNSVPNMIHQDSIHSIAPKINLIQQQQMGILIPSMNQSKSLTPNIIHKDNHSMISKDSLAPHMLHRNNLVPSMIHKDNLMPNMIHKDSLMPSTIYRGKLIPNMIHKDNLIPSMIHKDNSISNMIHKDNTPLSMNHKGNMTHSMNKLKIPDHNMHPKLSFLSHNMNHKDSILIPNLNQQSSITTERQDRMYSMESPKKVTSTPRISMVPQQSPNLSIIQRLHSTQRTLNLNPDVRQVNPTSDHLPLCSWRQREVEEPPLTLEDLATDSDSFDSQSAQHYIFR